MVEYNELVKQVQAGNVGAYNDLVVRFQDMAVGYAYTVLGDFHQAEDAAQESFLEAYRVLGQLREPAAFPGWFRRIVFKHCDRFTRKNQISTTSIDLALNVPDGKTPLDEMEEMERKQLILDTIEALPEHERTVITLYYISQFTQKDIAVFLEMSVSQVNNRLRHARKRLKERMLDMVEDTLQEYAPSNDDSFINKIGIINAAEAGDLQRMKVIIEQAPELAKENINERTPLHFAVIHGHIEIAQMLLDTGADPSIGFYPERETTTPLELARERGYDDIVEMLQNHMKNAFGFCEVKSSIFDFIEQDNYDQFFAYLKVDPDSARCADEQGGTPLHYVVQHKQTRMARPLLDYGADINAENVRGARPIHLAMAFGDGDMTRLLIDLGAEYELGVAAACGDTAFVRAALEKDPSLATWADHNGMYAISRAAHNGHLETVRVFLEYGVTCENKRETLDELPPYYTLSFASENGHLDVVRLLLDHGVDPDETTYYRSGWQYVEGGTGITKAAPLMRAARSNHMDVVRLLLERGAIPYYEIDSTGSAMDRAVVNQNLDMVDLLLEYGSEMVLGNALEVAKLRGEDECVVLEDALEKDPALVNHWAYVPGFASAGRVDLMKISLKYMDKVDTSLIHKTLRGHEDRGDKVEVARLLLEHGTDPNMSLGYWHMALLHYFAQGREALRVERYARYLEIAELVIEYGADLNIRDGMYDLTPLGWAARKNNLDYARLLLSKGAKTNLPDDNGITPLSIARNKGFTEMETLLEEHGAKA